MRVAASTHWRLLVAALILFGVMINGALAETVEVAPGIRLTKKIYAAPINEQPFFGFADKTPAQRAADDQFVQAVLASAKRDAAVNDAEMRGWRAIFAGRMDEAGRRFNQAFLIDPQQSGIYHGWAIIAYERFKDAGFADELFGLAKTQRNPAENLNADHGRFLLREKRFRDALPVLEQAVKDAPKFADAWSNLAFARLFADDRAGACAASAQATVQSPSANVQSDVQMLRTQAKCE